MVDQAAAPTAQPESSPWNVPNALTALRIVLVPVFAWMLLAHPDEVWWRVATAGVFLVAILTDSLDGHLARKHNLITRFGKIADPIADKALTGMAFVGLSIIGELWWWVTIVVLVREWGITLLRFLVLRHEVIAASSGGKLKTLLQTFALGLLILPLRLLSGPWETVGLVLWWVGVALMAAAVTVTVVTGVDYVVKVLAVRRAAEAK